MNATTLNECPVMDKKWNPLKIKSNKIINSFLIAVFPVVDQLEEGDQKSKIFLNIILDTIIHINILFEVGKVIEADCLNSP